MIMMRRMLAFTRFELMAIVAVVTVVVAALWTNTTKEMESAERMAMEAQARAIGNALQARLAVLIAQRQEREIVRLTRSNPMQWLPAQPGNYLGELRQAPSAEASLGSWYYDESANELVYRVRRGSRFVPDAAGQRQVRFRIELVRDEAQPGWNVLGAVFRPVEPYHWR